MSDLCPLCGCTLDFEWKDNGVSLKCLRCDYKTRAVYQREQAVFMDRGL